jgi:hypothetical protein
MQDNTNTNIDTIKSYICRKNDSEPYHHTIGNARNIITDFETFPYNRWWRGEHKSAVPIVIEREAGWRPWHDPCPRPPQQKQQPDICFSAACSTILPCHARLQKDMSFCGAKIY